MPTKKVLTNREEVNTKIEVMEELIMEGAIVPKTVSVTSKMSTLIDPSTNTFYTWEHNETYDLDYDKLTVPYLEALDAIWEHANKIVDKQFQEVYDIYKN